MYKEIIDAIAPTGILRAAVNLGNTLLISSQKPDGTPVGVSPDLVHRIAQDLNIPYKFVCFECIFLVLTLSKVLRLPGVAVPNY